MSKKFLALLLSAMCVFMLCACGNNNATVADNQSADSETAAVADIDKIKQAGVLVVGVTDFEPMDYIDADGNWVGFDADLATEFAKSLGVEVKFVEIDWDNKVMELNGGTVDCIWNGMTLTDEVMSSMSCSNAYCNNAQVVIVNKDVAVDYDSVDKLGDLNFAVEAGSAGAEQAQANNLNYTEVQNQASALMEVAAGTSDAAIIDSLMAAAMVGEGTSYENLTYTVGLNEEKYGVGFRQGSDLTAALNEYFKTSYSDGSMKAIAEKYGVQAALIEQ
ncbi:MAG: transporter substrate-binding domain-containing protein [Lachnospiraceae bacterium]|nr:transporter substrate-binding domain-containing protein [Lachnospiraceae bacterium]